MHFESSCNFKLVDATVKWHGIEDEFPNVHVMPRMPLPRLVARCTQLELGSGLGSWEAVFAPCCF